MVDQVAIVVTMGIESAVRLRRDGFLTECKSLETIPAAFKEVIKEFMIENVGFETGPVFCLTRINGEPISLRGSAFTGDLKVIDIMPVEAGDILLEFSVARDTMVSIGMDELLRLVDQARTYGEDNEIILTSLREALFIGDRGNGDENLYSFIPSLRKDDCRKFYRIDEQWQSNYKDILGGVEEVIISELSKF